MEEDDPCWCTFCYMRRHWNMIIFLNQLSSQLRMDNYNFVLARPSCSQQHAAELTDSILNMMISGMRPSHICGQNGSQQEERHWTRSKCLSSFINNLCFAQCSFEANIYAFCLPFWLMLCTMGIWMNSWIYSWETSCSCAISC